MEIKAAYKSKKINPIVFLVLAAVTIISLRWITYYSFYPSEPLINKIIIDLGDHMYFPFILNLSNLDFSPDYLLDYSPSKIIPIPIYYLIFHSVAYSIFSEYAFILIEYFSLFLTSPQSVYYSLVCTMQNKYIMPCIYSIFISLSILIYDIYIF